MVHGLDDNGRGFNGAGTMIGVGRGSGIDG